MIWRIGIMREIFLKISFVGFFFSNSRGSLVYNILWVVTLKMKFKRHLIIRWKMEKLVFLNWSWKANFITPVLSDVLWLKPWTLRMWVAQPFSASYWKMRSFPDSSNKSNFHRKQEIVEMKHNLWHVLPETMMALSSVVSLLASANDMSLQEDAWIGEVKVITFLKSLTFQQCTQLKLT